MSTIKQQKAARTFVQNMTSNTTQPASEMLENAGYGKGVAKTPGRVFKSKGMQNELKRLGFDLDSAKGVVTDILNTGDNRERILAAREIFKVVGAYARDAKDARDNERDLGLQAAIARISRILPD